MILPARRWWPVQSLSHDFDFCHRAAGEPEAERDGKPIIRTKARFSAQLSPPVSGQLQYLTRHQGEYEVGRYPFVGVVQEDFELVSMDFLEPESPVYGLRPKLPFNLKMALYTPKLAVCYPGGQQKLSEAPF